MKYQIKYSDNREPLTREADSFIEFVQNNRTNLTGADLSGANLTRANLSIANLTRANLTGANLTGADLTRANLSRANLTGANLEGTRGIASFMAPTSRRICYVLDHGDKTMIKLGCFWGTMVEAEAQIRKEHFEDAANIYIAVMNAAAVAKFRI